MKNNQNNMSASTDLKSLDHKIEWLRGRLDENDYLLKEIEKSEDLQKDLESKISLKSAAVSELGNYSPEARARLDKELSKLRKDLQEIDDKLRFLPGDKEMIMSRREVLKNELAAQERRWRDLQAKLELALAEKEKAEKEAAEEAEKKEAKEDQEKQMAAKEKAFEDKLQMSRGKGSLPGKSLAPDQDSPNTKR